MKMQQRPKLQQNFIEAFGFNAKNPVPILGEFKATLRCNYKRVRASFLVLDGHADNLMGHSTAARLGLVEIKEGKILQEYDNHYTYFKNENVYTLQEKFDPFKQYPDLFKDKIEQLNDIEVVIEVDENIRPIQVPPYPIPLPLMALTEAKIKKMLNDGIIEPAKGKIKWFSPMHVVPKINPDTKEVTGVRINSNNKALNKAIKLEKRWMPSIKTLTYELNGMKCFSKIDFQDAFNQVSIHDDSRDLTAFSTPWGVFRYCRLNMGLNVASELFQTILSDILRHIPNQKLATDDIIAYGIDEEDCKKTMILILDTLSKSRGYPEQSKCEFLKSEITFFGHKISANGIKPLEYKVKDFIEMEEPRNLKELHSFLAQWVILLIEHLIKPHILNHSELNLKKGGKWDWVEMDSKDMDKVKKTMLTHFNPSWITELIVDAGPEACASFLTQVNPKDPEHRVLIHCQSYAFSPA